MKSLIGFKSLVEREIIRFTSVFFQTIFPPLVSSFLYIGIFGFTIGQRMEAVRGGPYLHFLIPGLIMMYVIEGSYANTSSSLFISRWAGHIQEILVSPLSYIEMVLGFSLEGWREVLSLQPVFISFLFSLLYRPFIIRLLFW